MMKNNIIYDKKNITQEVFTPIPRFGAVEQKKESDLKNENIKSENEKKIENLLGKKKKKKSCDEDSIILKDIALSDDIHIRLLSNINGYFIDIRKYFREKPSQKGIRIAAVRFAIASEYFKKDIDALNLQYPEKEAIQSMLG